ncbi:hypothetical protein, partial [Bifidobacterium sp.]|uniref:hypothetical protein n=1 Tax=Bifidobacterium sp. TaxID=41200 RepID=UPI00284209D0
MILKDTATAIGNALSRWIAMCEMPGSAAFAPIHPKFSAAFTPTLVGGLPGRRFVAIHDFVRFDTAFGYEIMHSSP